VFQQQTLQWEYRVRYFPEVENIVTGEGGGGRKDQLRLSKKIYIWFAMRKRQPNYY
jgi:hypothetical protein